MSMRTPAFIAPMRWLTYSLLLIAFAYIIDDLLQWLGWRFAQNSIADVASLLLALLLLPCALMAWAVIQHEDTVDVLGLVGGCALAGALIGIYTMYPPAGLVTIIIFALLAIYVFHVAPRPHYVVIVSTMCLAFVAVTVLVSSALYAHQSLDATTVTADQVVHVVTHRTDDGDQRLTYECNPIGMLCQPIAP